MIKQERFDGFSQKTIAFLKGIAKNNNKPWFEAHRSEYEEFLLNPMRALVGELGEFMISVDPMIEIAPAVNKTISRIYRDTRFSKDKSLFRSNMWITFKRSNREWQDAPAFFFELSINWYRYGMGFYSASADTMRKFREAIDEKPEAFLKVTSFLKDHKIFSLAGEDYKRLLDGSRPPRIQQWYQKKNFYLVCDRKIDKHLFSSKLVDDLFFGFGIIIPLYNFLWSLKSRS